VPHLERVYSLLAFFGINTEEEMFLLALFIIELDLTRVVFFAFIPGIKATGVPHGTLQHLPVGFYEYCCNLSTGKIVHAVLLGFSRIARGGVARL